MSSEEEVNETCARLIRALMVIINPDASQDRKDEALRMCDTFLYESPYCMPCGLKLADRMHPGVVQQYGLKILEHVVKFRWEVTSVPEKIYLKKKALLLLTMGTKSILNEQIQIKEYVARIVVEITKNDWPKHWPELMSELAIINRTGETQSELVMFVLLMLSDEITLKKMPYFLGRPLKAAMHREMPEILELVKSALKHSGKTLCRLRNKHLSTLKVQVCSRVLVAALDTLAAYLRWMAVENILAQKCNLLRILCYLMDDSEMQVKAAECFIAAVNRIDDIPGASPMIVLFASTIRKYLAPAKSINSQEMTATQYIFMKKQCELLCAFGGQLCRSMETGRMLKSEFIEKYLNLLLDFTKHSSQSLSSITQKMWKDLFSHETLSRNPQLLAMIPKYLRATRNNLMKVGHLSDKDSPSSPYSRLDFSSDEEFQRFFKSFRNEQKNVIELICKLDHRTAFQIACECLKSQLSAPAEPGSTKSSSDTPYFLNWEAVTFFVKIIIDHVFKVQKTEDIPVNDGVELLQLVMNFKTKDPKVLACVQTNLVTLGPFLNLKNENLPDVLFKMIGVLEENKTSTEQSLRAEACHCILKICKDNGPSLLSDFEKMYSRVKQLLRNEKLQLTTMEKIALTEAMVILINHFKNYERQKALLEELMEPASSLLLSNEMQRVLSNPEAFIKYVGADLKVTGTVTERPTDLNRLRIIDCMFTILGVLRQTRWPTDLKEAKAGGFVMGFMPDGKPLYLNPCTEHVLKLLDSLFLLISVQHDIYLPEAMKIMSLTFKKALHSLHAKKNTSTLALHYFYEPSGYKTELERMQAFFCSLYETSFRILSHVVSLMKKDLTTMNDLAGLFCNSAFLNLSQIPCHRFLDMLRVFMKHLVHVCPPETHEVLSPIVGTFLTSLSKRLSEEWKIIDERNTMKTENPLVSISESDTLLEKNAKLLTGYTTEFLIACCVPKDADDRSVDTKSKVAASLSRKADTKAVTADTKAVTAASSEKKKADQAAEASWESFKTMMMSVVKENSNKSPMKIKEKSPVSIEEEDNTICTAESDDEGCLSNEDADSNADDDGDGVCLESQEVPDTIDDPAEPDDACGVSTANTSTIVAASVSDVACNLSDEDEDEENSVAAESDDDCMAVVPESDDVCSEFSETENAGPSVNAATEETIDDDDDAAKEETIDVDAESDADLAGEIPMPISSTGLTTLGLCLMKDEDVRSALLKMAFSCLVWNDSLIRYKKATDLCWLLLKQQAILEPSCEDTVKYCFTMALKGLQTSTVDKFSIESLFFLCFQIYESLRPEYKELKNVMREVAHVGKFCLNLFDDSLAAPESKKPGRNSMQYYFRRLLKYNIKEPINEKFHEQPYIGTPYKKRKNPPFLFKKEFHPTPFKKQKLRMATY